MPASENPQEPKDLSKENFIKNLDQHALIQAIVDISPIAIIISNLEGSLMYASQAALKQYGADRMEDLLGKNVLDFIAQEDRERAFKNVKKTLTDGRVKNIEYKIIRKDGSPHAGDLSASLVNNLQGKPAAFIAFVRDLTDVRQSEEMFQYIFNTAPVGIGIVSANGQVVSVNETMQKMTGYPLSEFKKIMVPDTYVHPEDRAKILSMLAEKGEIKEYEIELKRKGGEKYWASFSSKQIFIRGVPHFVTTQKDITEQKKAQEDAKRISEMKTNIITFASHELKTPLIPLLGWAELLGKARKNGEDLNKVLDGEDIESIIRSANRMSAIITDFLDVGRIDAQRLDLQYSQFDLKVLADEVLQTVAQLAKVQNINIHNEILPIQLNADHVRIEQVLVNLLSNAIKYSPPNSKVWMRVESDEKNITIIVEDQGFGFTKDELAEALQPFSKAFIKTKGAHHFIGTGVGLYICKGIVEKHGGSIKIESEGLGKGSKVSVTLPKQPPT